MVAKVGPERKSQAAKGLEREAEEEVQNGVAAEPLGVARYVLTKIR